jgi:hypothetical protein
VGACVCVCARARVGANAGRGGFPPLTLGPGCSQASVSKQGKAAAEDSGNAEPKGLGYPQAPEVPRNKSSREEGSQDADSRWGSVGLVPSVTCGGEPAAP